MYHKSCFSRVLILRRQAVGVFSVGTEGDQRLPSQGYLRDQKPQCTISVTQTYFLLLV